MGWFLSLSKEEVFVFVFFRIFADSIFIIFSSMKRVFLLVFTALAALMAVSCQKEEMGRILTATIEQYEQGGAKAYINNEYYACWENNDMVNINGTEYTISIPEGTQGISEVKPAQPTPQVRKIMYRNRIYIERDGILYDLSGRKATL